MLWVRNCFYLKCNNTFGVCVCVAGFCEKKENMRNLFMIWVWKWYRGYSCRRIFYNRVGDGIREHFLPPSSTASQCWHPVLEDHERPTLSPDTLRHLYGILCLVERLGVQWWIIYSMTCVDMHVCFFRFPSMLLCVGTSHAVKMSSSRAAFRGTISIVTS